ncbi:hypothetical protein HanRHA438_Chr10g0476761 [Helianthus annuus]|nr:hypothetical protein HanRHA438_Chr10g0476761 [Helianthus annuus]
MQVNCFILLYFTDGFLRLKLSTHLCVDSHPKKCFFFLYAHPVVSSCGQSAACVYRTKKYFLVAYRHIGVPIGTPFLKHRPPKHERNLMGPGRSTLLSSLIPPLNLNMNING